MAHKNRVPVSEDALENVLRGRWHKLPADRIEFIKNDAKGAVFECRTAFFHRMKKYLVFEEYEDGVTMWAHPELDCSLKPVQAVDEFFAMTGAKAVFRWKPSEV